MKYSLRAKILAAFAILSTLIFFVLFTGFSQLRHIAGRLDLIQMAYLPMITRFNSVSRLYHLHDGFSAETLVRNRANQLFITSVSKTSPRLFEQSVARAEENATQLARKYPEVLQHASWQRLHVVIDRLKRVHRDYVAAIDATIATVATVGDGTDQAALPEAANILTNRKMMLVDQIGSITRQLNQMIQVSIRQTVRQQRRAVYLTTGLSLFTLLVSVIIGVFTILGLRPLNALRKAARDIGHGDLDRRAPIESQDEIGALAQEFNRMADSIQERDQALKQQQEKLIESQKLAVVGQMASKISHEVRNPLNALSLNVELLQEELGSDAAGAELLRSIAGQIDRLNQITDHYLSLTRTPHLEKTAVDLAKTLRYLESLVQPECEQKGINYRFELPQRLPTMDINATALEQVLLNLSRNAIEAVAAGGDWGLQVTDDGHHINISVWDTGEGIPVDDHEKIFGPFYTTKNKGTGLGLAVTKDLVEQLGGVISVQAHQPQGARFTLSFPLEA